MHMAGQLQLANFGKRWIAFSLNLYILYAYTYQKGKEVPAPDPVPSLDRLTSASPSWWSVVRLMLIPGLRVGVHNETRLSRTTRMLIPITISPASTLPLPPQLAKLGNEEVVLIELQGSLGVECNDNSERDGQLVGKFQLEEGSVSNHISVTVKKMAELHSISTEQTNACCWAPLLRRRNCVFA